MADFIDITKIVKKGRKFYSDTKIWRKSKKGPAWLEPEWTEKLQVV